MITVNYHANHDKHFRARIEAVAVHDHVDQPYYSLALGWDVTIFLSDADCKAIMDALGGRPPLPETDAQIDAAREEVNAIGGEKCPF